jgi:acyl-[acyl-carrier-protein]-phospholipid O-acyltransferase/long-chain-fatty-acid--[acyl-carrier-protein] ligase
VAVEQQILAIVARRTRVGDDVLNRESVLSDLGTDSLDIVDMLLDIEDTFDVVIPEAQAAAFQTVGDLIAFVEKHVTGETAQSSPDQQPQRGGPARLSGAGPHVPALLRAILSFYARFVYRLRVAGRENVPQTGGALLVPNHVSLVDGLFLIASLARPVRFIVESTYFYRRMFYPFLRALGAIPISSGEGPLVVLRALRDAGAYLDRGELVCIFAEGEMTRTGLLLPFRRGMERIVKGRSAPVIPVHLDRVWGSIFSREGGRFLTKLPRRAPYPVTVTFGAPLAQAAPLPEVRRAVQELGAAAWEFRKPDCRPLHHGFVSRARRHPFRLLFADGSRPRVTGFTGLAGAIALARALRPAWQGQARVGILLPPSVAAGLYNLAAALAGRTSVNLNYTAGRAGLASAARQAGLRTAVTSRAFLATAKVELPDGVAALCMEDVNASVGRGSRLLAGLLALCAPLRLLQWACGAPRRPTVDDIATVIFSSGSTGEPKGVMLSHFNIDSNLQGAAQIYGITGEDRLMGILPLFHSFGYMSLWFAVNSGMGVIFHPNPLDAAAVGQLVERYRATILLATATFLRVYLRRCTPGQFGSLRVVLAGAEKLPERVAQAFEDRFGIRPLEGYGVTECAPVIAASTLDFRAAGFYQPGWRRGSVGQPLPGVAVRVIDRTVLGDDLQTPVPIPVPAPLPPGQEGLLLVKGPNVMLGYLGRDELTAKTKRDGWYVTGDVAAVDEDGFLRITGRLARFAKVGGEMVPLDVVEEALHEAAEKQEQTFALTAIPDEKRGERLAVLHTLDEAALPAVLDRLAAGGLPGLFLPRREHFVKVAGLPAALGTGKTDLREVNRIASDALAGVS